VVDISVLEVLCILICAFVTAIYGRSRNWEREHLERLSEEVGMSSRLCPWMEVSKLMEKPRRYYT